MRIQQIRQYASYLAIRLVICTVQAVRIESCAVAAHWMAWLFADVFRVRAELIDDNLRNAFPDQSPAALRRMSRAMWEHLFLFVAEVAHIPRKIHDTNWRDYVTLKNSDEAVRLLLDKRPVMLITAHHGNFELAGYILGILGFPTYSVARTLDNPYLDRFVNHFRGLTGQFIIPKKGGYDQILRVLAAGGTLSFLADQYAGTKGCWVNFFGRPASAHKAIALLALANDATLIVGSARRVGRPMHYELTIHATLDPRSDSTGISDIRRLTEWYTSQLEAMIRQAPEQYWWLHRRWKANRKVVHRKKKAA